MINFADALKTILECASPLDQTERVPIGAALSRYLAEDITARENVPIADNSAMDGYAVRQADLPDRETCAKRPLRVVRVLAAEQVASTPLRPGEAMKIMTGAPIPPGADAVVMVERTRSEDGMVWINEPPTSRQFIRPAGGDLKAGQPVLHSGQRLNSAHLGLLASMGNATVLVARRCRVGVLATGNELLPPEGKLEPGKVRNANSYALMGLVQETGAEPVFLGIAPDDRPSLKQALDEGLRQHDILVTSGGVSMGDFDFIKDLVDELGLDIRFKALNIKPGKPVVFGTRENSLFFGLPGNPVSAMVTFHELVRPALQRRMGDQAPGPRSQYARLAEALEKNDGKRHFMRGVLASNGEDLPSVSLTGAQDSNILLSMGKANCLVMMPEERSRYEQGAIVAVHLLNQGQG